MNDFTILKSYIKIFVVIFSIFGKELFTWIEGIFKDPGKNLGVVLDIVKVFQSIKISFTNKSKGNDVS